MTRTPGPWHATGEVWSGSNQTLPAGIFRYRVNDKGQEESIAQVWPPYACDYTSKDYARHAADLRLIVAAPDLLAALEGLMHESLGYLGDLNRHQVDATTLIGAIKIARRAIEKVQGE